VADVKACSLISAKGLLHTYVVCSSTSTMVQRHRTAQGLEHFKASILWRHGCDSELLGFLPSTNDKVKKNGRRQCQPSCWKSFWMISHWSYRIILIFTELIWMVEKKNTERFIGSNLQCCFHATGLVKIYATDRLVVVQPSWLSRNMGQHSIQIRTIM